ncbi:ATP synthase F1 subunit epsilon [Candidatus Saccharibacteria bacterium 32-50-13]|mgnify:CR=1 FL=1|nr:MAG: ATP synthase F1 subunit epsilon [Candidatus Saccharibacteria bacterium 32-50-13]
MRLELVTLTGVKLDQEIYQATIPTLEGEISVFPDHEDLVAVAVPGVISVRDRKDDSDDRMEFFAISGGVIEISAKKIRILVDEAEHGEEIVEAESRAALERALKLRDESDDQIELEKAHQMIDRHQVRLKVAELRRRKRR